MTFEISVVNTTPQTAVSDPSSVAMELLTAVGYIGRGADDEAGVKGGLPFRMFMECFLGRPDKHWTIEELIAALDTSRPTVYRHLNKLKAMDLLEETSLPQLEEGASRKAYRIRYGDLSKAWNFVEANVKVAMENYRKTVDHLQALAENARRVEVTA
ncbi:MAG: helix-turn-helix domain-containing protein [Thermoplasmatota archaeon]